MIVSSARTALCIAAHPDDEVLGCGGTLARLAREGVAVHVVILGEGATSRYASRDLASTAEVELLRSQALEAGRLLGTASTTVREFPDNRFDTVPLLELTKVIEAAVAEVRPQLVLTHHRGDLNIDHRLVSTAVITATRPLGGPVSEVLAWENPSSTEWAFDPPAAFHPNVFIDISTTLESKLEALAVYAGEARAYPHPRSPQAISAAAQRWGAVAGVGAAEAFVLVRSTR